ncbi:GDP-mannose 4,6-dehydratase [candidate division LCP-89 bacterium B3_LCP]|uniref:GDP-mannose 4,6-dehydratase n=1 Tax=candidate division LCP-89 bacterium B3_LCP TaxID=2012998 RepID=A0A532V534_UNCL8|nr:MAG: GDP-mannose 4,6-dehydratase [candidate division LCP-89 bacterium B3_LCP]
MKDFQSRAATQYRDRPILITGADGFIGSHLIEKLVSEGARIQALVRKPAEELKNISHLTERIELQFADITDEDQVLGALKCLQGERDVIIFHLAAEAHVGESWVQPEQTLQTNVLGTLNLLRAVCELNLHLHCFDYAGSSEEYGSCDPAKSEKYHHVEGGGVLLDELSPLNPKSVYAASKVAADFLCRTFFDAYDIPVVVSRMFNNFGPRQNPRFITGTVITQALSTDIVEIGSPHAKRDFTFVTDGVWGHLLTALYGEPGQVYVFGQGKNVSIGEWASLILDSGYKAGFWGPKELVSRDKRFRPGRTDEADLLADSSRLNELCGWQPEVTWEDGILQTINWYAENRPLWEGLVDWNQIK